METHRSSRIGWLRASVLGANDGIVSTASLVIGVASAESSPQQMMLAGVAGLVAGAMSMAAGEYVSVSSQADTEKADLAREKSEILKNFEHELDELTYIYTERGVKPETAKAVAEQLMARDALGSHAREELGITDLQAARPMQAAVASAATFIAGSIVPLAVASVAPWEWVVPLVSSVSIILLLVLGMIAAKAGGAGIWKGGSRVVIWGAFAMILTAGVGHFFGVSAP